MSKWVIYKDCIIDEDSPNQELIKGGKTIHLRDQAWNLLIAFLDAAKRGKYLSYNQISDAVWPEDYGWRADRKSGLDQLLKLLRREMGGTDSLTHFNNGYGLSYHVLKIPDNASAYYEYLWNEHVKGSYARSSDNNQLPDLIDYYQIPSFSGTPSSTDSIFTNESVSDFFPGDRNRIFINGSAGSGKTALLEILLLSNIYIHIADSDQLNSKKINLESYEKMRLSFFKQEDPFFIPFFIRCSSLDDVSSAQTIFELAEGRNIEGFPDLVDYAKESDALLLLIDLDGKEYPSKIRNINRLLKNIMRESPNIHIVVVKDSSKIIPFRFDADVRRKIKPLAKDAIIKISSCLLFKENAALFSKRINSDAHRDFEKLLNRPANLMVVLNDNVNAPLYKLIEKVFDMSMFKSDFSDSGYTKNEIKLLLGYLACACIFDDDSTMNLDKVRHLLTYTDTFIQRKSPDLPFSERDFDTLITALLYSSNAFSSSVNEFVFQSSLIKTWLAAYYIYRRLQESSAYNKEQGVKRTWEYMFVLGNIVNFFNRTNNPLSLAAAETFAILFTMCEEISNEDMKNSIVHYLVYRKAVSVNVSKIIEIGSSVVSNESEETSIDSAIRFIHDERYGKINFTEREEDLLKADVKTLKKKL